MSDMIHAPFFEVVVRSSSASKWITSVRSKFFTNTL